ncbi:MATE family efflux transporter [Streptomyces sp. CA-253872]|uniref:MATE family efflux transporter n=1 Tax=Streptomyces sp. CA-253872 TaxID=3240067 RepID=UPI003D89EA20
MGEHRRRLLALAGPVYAELLAGVAAGIINTVWVARLGGDAVAAVAVATNVENVLLGVVLVAGSGTTVLLARARGAGDAEAMRGAVRGGWVLWALVTPLVAIGGYAGRAPLAALVLGGGADPGALALTRAYFALALPGIAVLFASNVVGGVLKGLGDTRTPMRLSLLANGLILALDPLLVLALHLGVRGAALSTVLGRSVALLCGLVLLRRRLPRGKGWLAGGGLVADARGVAATGLPMSADFVIRMAGTLALVGVVARIGVAEVAAYGIATKALYVATMSFYAVRQATAIHTAHLIGAGREERAAVGREALRLSGGIAVLASAVLLAAGPWIVGGLGAGGAVAVAGTLYLRCVGPYLLLLACYIALGGVFEGSGRAAVLVRLTAYGQVLQLALAYALSGYGLPGVCLAMALATALPCAAAARLHRGLDPAVTRPS